VQDLSCTGHLSYVDVCIVFGVAQALTPHGEKCTSPASTFDRGVQDLSCTGHLSCVDVCIVSGVALTWRADAPMTAGLRVVIDALLARGRAMPALADALRG